MGRRERRGCYFSSRLPSETLGTLCPGEIDVFSFSLTHSRIQHVQPGSQGEFPVTFLTKEEKSLENLLAVMTEVLFQKQRAKENQGANI